MSNDLLGEARRLAGEHGAEELLSIELTNITPALVGSWNATRYTDPDACLVEPPRPTDIAGKTRWWLRAILAAGIYEEYGLHAPTYLLDEIASHIMGSTSDKIGASKIQIATEPLHSHQAPNICYNLQCSEEVAKVRNNLLEEAEQEGIQHIVKGCDPSSPEQCCRAALLSSRVLLNLLGHESDRIAKIPLPPGFYKFRLRVLWRPGSQSTDYELEQRLLGLALGLALFLTGIGRMTTRGYGKLTIMGLEEYNPATALAKEVTNVFYTLLDNEHALYTLSERATDYAKEYIESLAESRFGQPIEEMIHSSSDISSSMPLQETLHKNYIIEKSLSTGCIQLRWLEKNREKIIECRNDPWCIVAAISEAIKKTSIKHMVLGQYVHQSGFGIPSYVLGLPRAVYVLKDRHLDEKSPRLLSQIMFSILGQAKYIPIPRKLIIYGFRSILTDISSLKSFCNRKFCKMVYTCENVPEETRPSCRAHVMSLNINCNNM